MEQPGEHSARDHTPTQTEIPSAAGKSSVIDIFVKKPVLAIVVSLILVIAGLQAATQIPILQYPKIESSALVITTAYVGASAEMVQGFVTDPIERVAATVPGVDYVDSATTAGLSTVTVWLELNEDSTSALAELSSRLSQIRYELPAGARDPSLEVERADRSSALIYLDVAEGTFSKAAITDYLQRFVVPQLSSLEGVQRVEISGGRNPAMRLWLDAEKMASFNVSAQDLRQALTNNNVISAIGNTENNLQRINLLTNTTLQTAEDFRQLVILEADGALIRLGDIARVEMGEEEGQAYTLRNDEVAPYLAIWPQPGANEIAVGDEVYAAVDQINPRLPDGMHIRYAADDTIYMRDAIRGIFITLAETILLVGIVVLALMGAFRTSLVPLITIPVSILGAIAVITLMGFSLNLLTILAIVLSVGLVVDDAIVVVENVAHFRRDGMSRIDAALASCRQLAAPIFGMTITLAAVYAPIGFLSGLTGVLFKEFAFTLSVAVLISGIVALTLSPIMSAYVTADGGREGKVTQWVNQRFSILQEAYAKLLRKILPWRTQVLGFTLFVTLLSVPFYLFSQKELAPVEDQGTIFFVTEAPPNASLAYTGARAKEVANKLLEVEGTDIVWQIASNEGGFGGINMNPFHDRPFSVQELLPQVFQRLGQVPGLSVFPLLPGALPSAGRFDVEFVVKSPETLKEMKTYADQLIAAANASGSFMFVQTDLKIDKPQVRIMLDKARIADLGLNLQSVSDQLSILLSGDYINRFDLNGKAYQVIPMVGGKHRDNPEALLDLQLRTPSGELIPVSSIATLQRTVAPRVLGKFQQKNSFRLLAATLPGTSKEQALRVLEKASADILPANYTLDYAGESRQIRKEGNTLMGVLGIALLFVYFVLSILFNNFRDPLVVLLGSVPLALTGALLIPFLGLTTVNIYSQIGFITLVGLVAKNGILIVEFANHLQEQGATKLEAAIGAAELRLRPVLMTTAATVLGHFPLVLVTGAGAEARNSIGLILVIGMLIGTFFTLFVLPCLYSLLAKKHSAIVNDESTLMGVESKKHKLA